jgi:hypothetical protein
MHCAFVLCNGIINNLVVLVQKKSGGELEGIIIIKLN